jgi:glycogen debranching enzyme
MTAPTTSAPHTGATGGVVGDSAGSRLLQPFLHDLITCFRAPTVVLSAPDGQLRANGAQGVLHADVRVLSMAVLTLDDQEAEPVAGRSTGTRTASFTALARWLGDDHPDPSVRVDRERRVEDGALHETLSVGSTASQPVRTTVRLRVQADLADVETVKSGRGVPLVRLQVNGSAATWATDGVQVTAAFDGADLALEDDARTLVATWQVLVQPRKRWQTGWSLRAVDTASAVVAASCGQPPTLTARADDRRLAPWLERSLDDLAGLRMATRSRPDDTFVAAGIPWYLTLFGRDSIWAARLLLPTGTELAAGTLRTLAAVQGTRHDADTDEQPGKILHELRRSASDHGGMHLPPLYYGTVDATPLWICLLHDAWRWGMDPAIVSELLPNLEAALGWMAHEGDSDGDGFLEYADQSGRGLTNQGWKDSGDAIRFADGRQALGPVALCEVQGYAHEAAVGGAALLEAFGRPGAQWWRIWAGELRERFRARFWVGEGADRRPALALDGAKRAVDSTTSNIGHLLGTGLLDAAEEEQVARRVTRDDLDGGLGLRTMSALDGGYSPLSYHCGSVWPHDTAIVVRGLARSGHLDLADGLVEGLLRASATWGGRLPELWSGESWPLVPYPASCRPQAWSAAAAVTVLEAALGVDVDVPGGTLRVRARSAGPLGGVQLDDLRVAGERVRVARAVDGTPTLSGITLDVLRD